MKVLYPLVLFLAMAACSRLTGLPAIMATATHAVTPVDGPVDFTNESGKPLTATVMQAPTHAVETPTVVPTALNQEPAMVFFTSEPGKFQVWLPVSESVQEFTIKQTLFGEAIECPRINFMLNGAYAFVGYCDLVPGSTASLSDEEILDQASSEVFGDIHTKLDGQESLVVQDRYSAQALSGQVDMRGVDYNGRFKARVILAEGRLYFVAMSVYLENWCKCLHQIDQVVDSLYIEPGLTIPFEPTP